MPTDPLTAIWPRLDRNPPLFFDDQLEPAFAGSRDRIFALGLLRAAEPSGSAACLGCERGYAGRVVWETDARTGLRVAYLRCPACGPVPIDAHQLRQWAIDIPAVLNAVRDAGRIRGTITEVVPGHLWHLGNGSWRGRRREGYFLRCVHEGTRAGVAAAVTTHPNAILFFPTEATAHKWGAATGNVVVALESVISLGPDGLTFDAAVVEGRLADSVCATPKRKKPPKRGSRASNIALLTEALLEHLRRARDHAFSTEKLQGIPMLLPRPSKTQLAELTRLSKADVSKCFKDGSARELNYYWDLAGDLDRVMAFRGRISLGAGA